MFNPLSMAGKKIKATGDYLLEAVAPGKLLGWIILAVGVAVPSLWILLLLLELSAKPDAQVVNTLGPLGDSFGAITAMFTGGALALSGAALLIQAREFKESRESQEQMARTQKIQSQIDAVRFMMDSGSADVRFPSQNVSKKAYAYVRGKNLDDLSPADEYEIFALTHREGMMLALAALKAKLVHEAMHEHKLFRLVQERAYGGSSVNGTPSDEPYDGGEFGYQTRDTDTPDNS